MRLPLVTKAPFSFQQTLAFIRRFPPCQGQYVLARFDPLQQDGTEVAACVHETLNDEDGGGLALFGGGEVGFILGEGEFAGARVLGWSQAGDLDGAVADDFGVESLGDLSSREGHKVKRPNYRLRTPTIRCA